MDRIKINDGVYAPYRNFNAEQEKKSQYLGFSGEIIKL